MDHISDTLFYNGVPDSAILYLDYKSLMDRVILLLAFFIYWASSRAIIPKYSLDNYSASVLADSYDIIIIWQLLSLKYDSNWDRLVSPSTSLAFYYVLVKNFLTSANQLYVKVLGHITRDLRCRL
jgi:hypothetical protein